MKRWMALDMGKTDWRVVMILGVIAQGGGHNQDRAAEGGLRRLAELFRAYQCTGLVIGLSFQNGRAGEEAQKSRILGFCWEGNAG